MINYDIPLQNSENRVDFLAITDYKETVEVEEK